MKKMKVSILALSVLVGGAVFASAADKPIVAGTANVAVTNVAPLLWVETMGQIPHSPFVNTTNLNPQSIVIVDTDGSGKISGLVNLIKDWKQDNGTNPATFLAQSSWIGTVKGSVKASKMGQPTVQMTIQANGYTSPTTNLLLVNNQRAQAGNSSLNINFKSTTAAVPINTNNLNLCRVAGSSKIQFKPGVTVIQSSKSLTETATLDVYQNIEKELDMRVVSYGSKFGIIFQDLFGTGSSNSKGAFNVNLKGGSGGSNLQLKGQLAAIAYISGGATNIITTISTVEEKGKVQGQTVNGQGVFKQFN
jgi:hypothetical protein